MEYSVYMCDYLCNEKIFHIQRTKSEKFFFFFLTVDATKLPIRKGTRANTQKKRGPRNSMWWCIFTFL